MTSAFPSVAELEAEELEDHEMVTTALRRLISSA